MNLLQYATLKVRAPDTMKMLGAIAGTMSDLTSSTNAHSKTLAKSEADDAKSWDEVQDLKSKLSAAEDRSKTAHATVVEAEGNFATVQSKQLEVSGMIHTLFEEITT